MLNSFFKIFYFILIILFFYFVLSTYFSKKNISIIENKIFGENRKTELKSYDLPIMKNDTDNIIIFNTDDVIQKKIKKRKIRELLK